LPSLKTLKTGAVPPGEIRGREGVQCIVLSQLLSTQNVEGVNKNENNNKLREKNTQEAEKPSIWGEKQK